MDCPTCARLGLDSTTTEGKSVDIPREEEGTHTDTEWSCSNGHTWTHATVDAPFAPPPGSVV